jgi:glycine betaine/proline transport system substrate-binding protein
MKRFFLVAGSICVLISIFSGPAKAVDVVLPDPGYPGGTAIVNVIKTIAEQRLGLDVDLVKSSSMPVIWKAMDAGNGDIDVWPEVWMPNQKSLVDEYVTRKGTVKLGSKPYNALNGICITRTVSEDHGIKSVYDLTSAKNAQLFDTDGNGKGEMWIGPNGWMSTNVEKIPARDYGYGEFFDLLVMEEAAALARLDAANKREEPFVFYCYAPHHIFKMYDLVVLEEPTHDPEKFKMVQPSESSDWYEQSHVSTAWGDTLVYISYAKTLEERSPQFASMLDNMALTSDLVSEWVFEVGVNKRDPESFSEQWVKDNGEIVDSWLSF